MMDAGTVTQRTSTTPRRDFDEEDFGRESAEVEDHRRRAVSDLGMLALADLRSRLIDPDGTSPY
jgi:hypothetical protein